MKRESGRGRWRVVWGQQRLLDWGLFGAWLSLVERLVRDQEAGGSNPLAPTNYLNALASSICRASLTRPHEMSRQTGAASGWALWFSPPSCRDVLIAETQ
jgi:hypothetical protein